MDVTAVYTDSNDVVWVGSQSWGNVVEASGTRLVGHGKRGIDQTYTRTQWFVRALTGVPIGPSHINFPFAPVEPGSVRQAALVPRRGRRQLRTAAGR